jgi:hypothetical protein
MAAQKAAIFFIFHSDAYQLIASNSLALFYARYSSNNTLCQFDLTNIMA